MLTLYTAKTPNGKKPTILLEELGIPYEMKLIDLTKNEQFTPDFLRLSPNNKIPAIQDGSLTLFESGAILTYLAEKHGRFLPRDGELRYKTLEWVNWQMGGLGPMLGQLFYFGVRAKEKVPHAIDRFTEESIRLLGVMDKRLQEQPYLAGADYTIADMMCYPWIQAGMTYMKSLPWEEKTALKRWMIDLENRPGVQKGMAVLS